MVSLTVLISAHTAYSQYRENALMLRPVWDTFSAMIARRTRTIAAASFLTAILALAGCGVHETVSLRADGSGTARLEITLHPIMVSYMGDLMAAMTGVEGEYPIFDTDQIIASFAEREGVELVELERRARGSLRMDLSFENLASILDDDEPSGLMSFDVRGSNREVSIRLGSESVQQFMGFAPEESATMSEFILPPADGSVSAEEYREEMAWALEEYEDRAIVERILDESMITVRIESEGRILRQRGGAIDGDAVVFAIPVLEILTLEDPRVYSFVFAP